MRRLFYQPHPIKRLVELYSSFGFGVYYRLWPRTGCNWFSNARGRRAHDQVNSSFCSASGVHLPSHTLDKIWGRGGGMLCCATPIHRAGSALPACVGPRDALGPGCFACSVSLPPRSLRATKLCICHALLILLVLGVSRAVSAPRCFCEGVQPRGTHPWSGCR